MFLGLKQNKDFYKRMLKIAIPVMIQNGITNFVSLLDNIMVGRIGTEQMVGTAIVNQLLFVFNLAIFGALSGAGIFGAQFFGCKDDKGVRYTFRYKWYISMIIVVIATVVLVFFDKDLINLYLMGEGADVAKEASLMYGHDYMMVMLIGLLPFAVEQIYSSTLREGGETVVPMVGGVVAVLLNLFGNYVLIFGHFGFPALGAVGAAIATVISRYVDALIVVIWTHRHSIKMPFIKGAYSGFSVTKSLALKITIKGCPLMLNEVLWAAGMATLNRCYSLKNYDVVGAQNISSTVSNLFNVTFIALGSAISIIIGQLLGSGKLKEAKEAATRMIRFSVLVCVGFGAVMFALSPLFPRIYNTTDEIKKLATSFLMISAACMPIAAFLNSSYFTIRSGGKTLVTFLFDSAFLWVVSIPCATVLVKFTNLNIEPIYATVLLLDLIKCVIGYILVKKGIWINNLVESEKNVYNCD